MEPGMVSVFDRWFSFLDSKFKMRPEVISECLVYIPYYIRKLTLIFSFLVACFSLHWNYPVSRKGTHCTSRSKWGRKGADRVHWATSQITQEVDRSRASSDVKWKQRHACFYHQWRRTYAWSGAVIRRMFERHPSVINVMHPFASVLIRVPTIKFCTCLI